MADDCVTQFNDLKLKHSMKYIIYKMNEAMTQIEVRTLAPGVKSATCFQEDQRDAVACSRCVHARVTSVCSHMFLRVVVWAQVHTTGGKDATYADFLKELPEAECRYGVFDVEYEDPKTQNKRNKITFFAWYNLDDACLLIFSKPLPDRKVGSGGGEGVGRCEPLASYLMPTASKGR